MRLRLGKLLPGAQGGLEMKIFMIFDILVTFGFQVVDLSSPLAPSTANARSPRLVKTIPPRVLGTRVSTVSKLNCWIFRYFRKCDRFFLFCQGLGSARFAVQEYYLKLQVILKLGFSIRPDSMWNVSGRFADRSGFKALWMIPRLPYLAAGSQPRK